MGYYVCQRSDLEEKKPYLKDLNGLVIGVILLKDKIYAYENRCPHMEGPVCLGDVKGKVKTKLNENKEACGEYESEDEVNIVCPWHGLEFDIASGVCIPESNLSLNRFEAYVKDDQIFIDI
jgi:nitrite reductase/ring-hydroxylating ferredoxin subunit